MKKEFMHGAGYTTVYLVVNMNQFVDQEDQSKFENLRGTHAFKTIIFDEWERILKHRDSPFKREEQFITGTGKSANENRMNVDDVAFNTGIFKGIVLRDFSGPFYKVDKSAFHFDPLLVKNLQFKSLFLQNWERWDIHIRPTMTGMFVIRLTNYYDHAYGTESAEFRTISSNVQSLQSSFDVPSAIDRREELRIEIEREKSTQAKENFDSIQCLLEWLGADRMI